jgi:hypothetical protein
MFWLEFRQKSISGSGSAGTGINILNSGSVSTGTGIFNKYSGYG